MFTPRLSKPDRSDPLWNTISGGGYNKCIPISGTCVLPNCTGYAYGRFMEILNVKECNLPTSNAGQWFGSKTDGYSRGKTPKLGAVGCWGKLGQAGHVGIVEVINPDGSIVTSNSEYGGDYFETYNLKPPGYTWGNGFYLQGFIYLPTDVGGDDNILTSAPKPITDLISKAKSYVGKNKSAVQKLLKTTQSELSAKFVCYCINKVADLSGKIYPKESISPSQDIASAIAQSMGTFISRKTTKGKNKPSIGDLILIRKSTTKRYINKYSCDALGIVTEVSDDSIKAVQYISDKVQLKTYSTTNNLVQGYYRPNYSKVKGIADSVNHFYDTSNTDEDMMIREVAFLDKDNKPSKSISGIRLGVINYTSYIGDLLSSITVADSFGTAVNADGISNPVAKQIIEFLIGKGLPSSSACGICGNIEAESGYKVGIMEYGYSEESGGAGICQWTNDPRWNPNGRKSKMKKFVGSDWKTNLTGQLEYLWYELQTDYPKLLSILQSCKDNAEGVKESADAFLRRFESPTNPDGKVAYRQGLAMKLWNSLSVQIIGGNQNQSTSIMSSTPVKGTEIEIPAWVNQDRMSANYTNYTYYFKTWGYIQRKIADKWDAQGRPSNRNIATLDGMYLMACTLIFGTTGDKISVILEDGTVINCLIADSKGDDPSKHGEAGNIYGHAFGNGQINIVEWEKKGISSHWQDNTTVIDLTGWQGKRIKKIINGGAYIR